ncbi:zf-TFIIB domain-containing protein [Nocardioides bigeumensis]|uniref:Zf-TFIIB domain-containing protein n=1 Tax=Nocardioides bigeumensis TaxID=433657 RepID=A0ABP5KDS5_9ACTN
MQCPTDQTVLVMSERSGIEIDYCPTCRGVWLDRGELDKIIERAEAQVAPSAAPAAPQPSSYERERDDRRQHFDQRYANPQQGYPAPYQGGRAGRKKKESWLSELFD